MFELLAAAHTPFDPNGDLQLDAVDRQAAIESSVAIGHLVARMLTFGGSTRTEGHCAGAQDPRR